MERLTRWVNLSAETKEKLLVSIVVLILIWIIRRVICSVLRKRIIDLARFYHWRRIVEYTSWCLIFMLIGTEWIRGVDSIATFLGLTGAGLAIAMHDTVANLAGWIFILWRHPFAVGDRIQIEQIKGDVIDIRLFQFSLIEVGNWVDSEQSTGRIIHIPNGKVLREPIANYETGFEYIWHEIPVLITFESDWMKAKAMLMDIAQKKAEHLSMGAEEQIRRAAMKYLIHFSKLTPTVYTTVKDSGVLLTIRYIVKPRRRRGSEQDIWEAILTEFAKTDDINLAYPTTRFYSLEQAPLLDPQIGNEK